MVTAVTTMTSGTSVALVSAHGFWSGAMRMTRMAGVRVPLRLVVLMLLALLRVSPVLLR